MREPRKFPSKSLNFPRGVLRGLSPVDPSSLLPRRRGGRRILRPLGLPLLDVVRLVRGGGEIDQAVDGIGEADLALLRNRGLALLHPRVALLQEWFGFGVFLLAQQGSAEERLRVEGGPDVGLSLLADGQALAEERFGLDPFLLPEQGQTDLAELAGQFGAVLGQRLRASANCSWTRLASLAFSPAFA